MNPWPAFRRRRHARKFGIPPTKPVLVKSAEKQTKRRAYYRVFEDHPEAMWKPQLVREPMDLDELCERLPAREARLLRLIMAQGVDQAEACDQLRRLIEGRRR
jgi:hypothetical protein